MTFEITNLKIDQSVYDFCKKYVDENIYNRDYDNSRLLEYYPKESFISNLEIKRYCIGVLPTGFVQEHVDDDRESCLIIPIDPLDFIIKINKEEIKIKNPFILDTTILHSANMLSKSIFLALDFNISFIELKKQISKNEQYFIKISQI